MPDPLELRRELLRLAVAVAEEAGRLTLDYFGGTLEPDLKGDGTPVTAADRGAETRMRERILDAYPSHGILGEEFEDVNAGADVRWILDPIDGTKSFIHGVPLYGVLVGVEIEGNAAVGVAHFPALGETVAAASGAGCRWRGAAARVSSVDDLDRAVVLTTDDTAVRQSPVGPGWEALSGRALFGRTWGDCYGHCLVATGRAEAMVDPELNPWDAAPLLPILTEAGGRFTDLAGEATIHGGSGVSTNGKLHEEVLKILAGDAEEPEKG